MTLTFTVVAKGSAAFFKIYEVVCCVCGRQKGDKRRPQTPELKGESRQSRCCTTPSSPASRTKETVERLSLFCPVDGRQNR